MNGTRGSSNKVSFMPVAGISIRSPGHLHSALRNRPVQEGDGVVVVGLACVVDSH